MKCLTLNGSDYMMSRIRHSKKNVWFSGVVD